MLYASGFVAGDPFIWMKVGRRSMLIMSDLEFGRAREQSKVDEVLSLSEIDRRLRKGDAKKRVAWADIIAAVLKDHGASAVKVPGSFPLSMAESLRKRKIDVSVKEGLFFPERAVKSPREVAAIEQAQRATEEAVEAAVVVLRRSKPRGSKLYVNGDCVTSELLKGVIHRELMDRECAGSRTIVAGGDQGCDPHNTGSGPIAPDRTVVMDVFPRSTRTMYYADMTRTVVKGKASPQVRKMYEAVREAQELGIAAVRPGADGLALHNKVKSVFDHLGYKTERRGGKMVGYFHGTGHGVGLDIHEAPWITSGGTPLPAGAVVTVEPGLYYPG